MSKKSLEEAFNQLLLQITGKQFFDNSNIKKTDITSRIEKCIELTKEEYSYALSLQADCVPEANRMIVQSQNKLESLNSLLTLAKLI